MLTDVLEQMKILRQLNRFMHSNTRLSTRGNIVEITGDEMADVMWNWIKDQLINPYLKLNTIVYDLSISNRDGTHDSVTKDAAHAINKTNLFIRTTIQHGVGIKCATITPDEARVKEFGLKKMWKSPNATIRNIVGGTIFRQPIVCPSVPVLVPSWKKPIIVARHAHADQYDATEMLTKGPGIVKLLFESECAGENQQKIIKNQCSSGIVLSMYNTDKSIEDFARSCFQYAVKVKMPMFLSTKNTVLKIYDGRFKDIFEQVFKSEFKLEFDALGISYQHRLIDDMVAMCLRSEGGFVWALKNYDGDVMSDLVAQGYGSLGLMTSVLLTPDGRIMESEAAHGTVTKHFRKYQRGERTSTNPVASIFAWSRGIAHRARLDDNSELKRWCKKLEDACVETIEAGKYTKDLGMSIDKDLTRSSDTSYLSSLDFIKAVRQRLDIKLSQ